MENRIYTIGDLHGGEDGSSMFLETKRFPEQKKLTKLDVLIQLGDFGYIWYYDEYTKEYRKDLNFIKTLINRKFTTLIIDGNHENFDLIYKLPIIEKWGGKVREYKINDKSLYIAIRGEVYIINNKKIFTFGGAQSSCKSERCSLEDYLNGKEYYKKRNNEYIAGKRNYKKKYKSKDINWWSQELPTKEEYENGIKNLEKNNWQVDYVFSHNCPIEIGKDIMIQANQFCEKKISCPVAKYLEEIEDKLEFKEWHFGHYHYNTKVLTKYGAFFCHYKSKPYLIC